MAGSIVLCPAFSAAFLEPLRRAFVKRGSVADIVKYPGLDGRPGTFSIAGAEESIAQAFHRLPAGKRGLLGYSTGGFFAVRAVAAGLLSPDFLVLASPVADWSLMDRHLRAAGGRPLADLLAAWVGRRGDPTAFIRDLRRLRPDDQASAKGRLVATPTILLHGSRDTDVPREQVEAMGAALSGHLATHVLETDHFYHGLEDEICALVLPLLSPGQA